tara:strand:+ start:608 stop:1609 length:1002 start_codon:yes stop_codon:yes gene_type:complete
MHEKVKVLIIRFSSIGDIVLTTPVIRCLKTQMEGTVELHYLTMERYQGLLINNPYIDHIHSIQKSTNEVIEVLKKEHFDYIIDLHKNLRSFRVKKQLKSLSFSFNKLNIEKWLLVNFKIDRMPPIHIVDRYLESCKAFGIENDGLGLDYFFPEDKNYIVNLSEEFNAAYVAVVIGANHNTKRLPTNRLIEMVKQINRPIVLLGGSKDAGIAEEVMNSTEQVIYNAVGQTNFDQSAYLLKKASAIISPDTGMMHIAAAFNKIIISLWGNTVPSLGMYPYLKKGKESNSKIFEVKDLSCRPCSKIGFDNCPKKHFKCMNQLPLEKIASLALRENA